jgi:Gram-negative porin
MMKKFIQSAFLLAFSSALLSSNSFAQTSSAPSPDGFSNAPSVTVGGFINSNGGVRGESGAYVDDRLPDAVIANSTTSTIGGTLHNTVPGQVDPAAPGTKNRMTNNPDFANDSEVYIKAGGINEYGMKYGAVVQLEADVSTDATKQGFNASRSFIFTESNVGKVEFGNNIGANQKMKVGPANFARAAGGINGKYLEYINLPMLADSTQLPAGTSGMGNCAGFRFDATGNPITPGTNCSNIKLPRFILLPTSPISQGGYAKGFYNRATDNEYSTSSYNSGSFNNGRLTTATHDGSFGQLENATKVSYYIPRISGWQLGASFTPDTGNRGSSASFSGDNSGDMKNVVSWGINYSDNFDNLGLAFSATGERGSFEQDTSATVKRNDLNAYEVGGMMTFFGFTLGGSYGSWGKSLQPKSGIYSCDYNGSQNLASQNCDGTTAGKKFDDSTYYTAGGAYQFGPIAASVTHIKSEFQKNQYQATSFGIDYKMAKGLMPYIEVTKFKFTSNQSTATDANQAALSSSQRQIKDNSGYVALAGILLAF